MYKTYYRVEMVNGSGSFPDKYDTYETAYDVMCKNYVREINEGYKPTLYKVVRYDHSEFNGYKNTMIQPCWSQESDLYGIRQKDTGYFREKRI